MEEIWKDAVGYEGLYKVSNLGHVLSCKKNLQLKPQKDNRGYLYVGMTKDRIHKNCKIHRLVALAFIPNPKNLPEVNHKDEVKENNCVENLEWISTIDNCNYGTRNKRISNANKGSNHYLYGKHRSEETKQKLREKNSGTNAYWYGKKLSNETRKKMSESSKGEKNPMYGKELSESHKKKLSRPVYCVETNIVYYGAKEAERRTGVFRNSITKCCKGKRKTAGKLHWRYATKVELEDE